MQRTDDNGTWLVQDDGAELLIEPSEAWIAAHPPSEVDITADPITALRDNVAAKMSDPAVNSIAKLKAAITAAFDDALG